MPLEASATTSSRTSQPQRVSYLLNTGLILGDLSDKGLIKYNDIEKVTKKPQKWVSFMEKLRYDQLAFTKK